MKNPILIGLSSASILAALNASASDPSAELISDMKNGQGLNYAGDIPSTGDNVEIWIFFDKEKFPVFMPADCGIETMIHLAWSQRMLIHWEKANGFLK